MLVFVWLAGWMDKWMGGRVLVVRQKTQNARGDRYPVDPSHIHVYIYITRK